MTVVLWEHAETHSLKLGEKKLFPIGNVDAICVKYVKYINLSIRKNYTSPELGLINKYMNIRIMASLLIIVAKPSK